MSEVAVNPIVAIESPATTAAEAIESVPVPVEVAPIVETAEIVKPEQEVKVAEGEVKAAEGEAVVAPTLTTSKPKRSPLGEIKNFFASKSNPTSPTKEVTQAESIKQVETTKETATENTPIETAAAATVPTTEEAAVTGSPPKKNLFTQLKSLLEPKPKKAVPASTEEVSATPAVISAVESETPVVAEIPVEAEAVEAESTPVVEATKASEVAAVKEIQSPKEVVEAPTAAVVDSSAVKFDAATKEAPKEPKEKSNLIKLGRRLSAKVFPPKEKKDLAAAIEAHSTGSAAVATSGAPQLGEIVKSEELTKVEEPIVAAEAPKVVEESKVAEVSKVSEAEEAKVEGTKVEEPAAVEAEVPKAVEEPLVVAAV